MIQEAHVSFRAPIAFLKTKFRINVLWPTAPKCIAPPLNPSLNNPQPTIPCFLRATLIFWLSLETKRLGAASYFRVNICPSLFKDESR